MTTINVRREGAAVVLEISDDVKVRCKLRLTDARAIDLSNELANAAVTGSFDFADAIREIIREK